MDINLAMKNDSNSDGRFRVFMGTSNNYDGCASFPFINYNGIFGVPYGGNPVPCDNYADVLDLGVVKAGDELKDIRFFTAVTAGSCAPLVIGIRRV